MGKSSKSENNDANIVCFVKLLFTGSKINSVEFSFIVFACTKRKV